MQLPVMNPFVIPPPMQHHLLLMITSITAANGPVKSSSFSVLYASPLVAATTSTNPLLIRVTCHHHLSEAGTKCQ